MEYSLYQLIKNLCAENNITIARLESELGFGNSSINKWGKTTSPSIDKIVKVAKYFCVSTDYLLGRTDIKKPISEITEDEDIITLQRARERMSQSDRERMMKMLHLGFEYAFKDEPKDK